MNNSLQNKQNEAARQPFLPGPWAARFAWLWLVFLLAAPLWAAPRQKVTLQLKWHHQFQFAGYYAAQIKGFYQANGLEVTLLEAGPTQMPLPTVEAGKAEFGVSDMEVFQAYLEGKPLVTLGVVFQHSPNVILALRKSGIHRPADLVGRKVMFQGGQGLVETRAMLEAEGLSLDQVQQVPHSWNLDDLLQGRIDGLSAYSTNESFLLKARGADLVELRPIEYGVDFYGDLLFTTQRFAEQNPALTEAFRRASFQGWEYAMEHPEEIIEHILALPGVKGRGATPDKLRFEAARMKELLLPGLVDAGHMNPGRFRRIAQIAMKQGLIKAIRDPDGFLFEPPVPITRTVLRALTLGAAVALGIVLIVGLWILQLRRTVESRTKALQVEVAQRQQQEEALRESKAQYDNLVGRIPIGVYLIRSKPDQSFGFDFASPKMAELFGVDLDALRKDVQLCFQAVHPDDLEHFVKLNQDGLKFLVPFFWEGRVVVAGAIKWLHIAATPESLADGDVLWHGVVADITERKQTEMALRDSERQFRSYTENAPIGIFICDQKGRYLEVNPAATAITGYSREELLSMSIQELLTMDAQAEGAKSFGEVVETGHASSEMPFKRKNGEIGHWSIEAVRLSSTRFLGFANDTTHRKAAELEQQSLQARLQQTQKMESLGSLAGGVAHDMNNVLGAILGLSSVNQELVAPDSSAFRAFQTITKAAIRGGEMVKSLLSFARQSPAEMRAIDLNSILREEVLLLERTTLAKIQLRLELAPDLRPIQGDGSALAHVFMNLCVNAVDAMAGNGTLTLRTRNAEAGWVEVQIVDTGEGMTREVQAKALDPFFTTKEVGKGTGLGLSMAYSTVTAHRGQMSIESEPGQGTCITLRFPGWVGSPQAPGPGDAPESRTPPKALSILLVDDDDLIQSSIQMLLEALGHRSIAASSGEEALEKFKGGLNPDLVILDMNMPGLGGAGTLPRLRALRPDLPVLLATGRADQSALDLVDAYGKASLLAKPFSMKELQGKIEEMRIG